MTTNSHPVAPGAGPSLGGFLRDRRSRLSPAPGSAARRRTPGLRREEVAARAGVSVTWYTWLEQGRGGPPSDDVLERLASALELDGVNRELMFLLAQQRPPPLQPVAIQAVPAGVQRVLDAMPRSPAYVQTMAFDVIAWNRAMTLVLGDYGQLAPHDRNPMRRLFGDATLRGRLPDWEANARFAVSFFRIHAARLGANPEIAALQAELAESADFRRLWAENEVRNHGVAVKRIHHPTAGVLHFEYTQFAVDGSDGLQMVVFTPIRPTDEQAIARLLEG